MTECAGIRYRACSRGVNPAFFLLVAGFLTVLASCSTVRPTQEASLPREGYAVASWYGPKFDGRPTSSGEIFDMHALTCAHKQYPFGTKLQVTNILNNKTVQCTVNDRGPFVEGRDIDLSYGAAKAIGLIGPGTCSVYLRVTGRDLAYIKRVDVQADGGKGPFAIQVGSFSENLNAVRLKTAVDTEYRNVYIQEIRTNGGTYYRVKVGNYDILKDALDAAEQLGREGYSVLVVKADAGN